MLSELRHSRGRFAADRIRQNHPTSGDCGGCHTTAADFLVRCHEFGEAGESHSDHRGLRAVPYHGRQLRPLFGDGYAPGRDELPELPRTHVATTFANVTIATLSTNHIPIGSLDCNGSGCHTTANVHFRRIQLGAANITSPTLSVGGSYHGSRGRRGVPDLPRGGALPGNDRQHSAAPPGTPDPPALDKNHPDEGDCGGCHTTTPTFSSDCHGSAKPANHIPTNAACAQCHTTAGNFAALFGHRHAPGRHELPQLPRPAAGRRLRQHHDHDARQHNHIPIGALDCNGSGCHTTTNVNPGRLQASGRPTSTAPTLNVAGHTTVAAAVPACQTCHETAPYQGMSPAPQHRR